MSATDDDIDDDDFAALRARIDDDDTDDDLTPLEHFPPERRRILANKLMQQSRREPGSVPRVYLDEALQWINPDAVEDLMEEVLLGQGKNAWEPHHESVKTVPVIERARAIVASQRREGSVSLRNAIDLERMTHTEITLRLALHLLREEMTTSDVHVALIGREVTRRRNTLFDVGHFLSVHGCTWDGAPVDAFARFAVDGARHALRIVPDRGQGSVVAEIGPGSRLVVHATSGPTVSWKHSREDAYLRNALASALARFDVGTDDLLAVALPRSPRMRRIVRRARTMPRLVATGISLVLVDAIGEVDGLPLPGKYRPPSLVE